MPIAAHPKRLWNNWLLFVAAAVIALGAFLVLAPSFARQGFSLLVYPSSQRIDSFDHEQARYISLAHAVIGAVMVGWGTTLLVVTRTLFASGAKLGWNLIAISVVAWFVPDTSYSLPSGYWPNAVPNSLFFGLFALALWATRSAMRSDT